MSTAGTRWRPSSTVSTLVEGESMWAAGCGCSTGLWAGQEPSPRARRARTSGATKSQRRSLGGLAKRSGIRGSQEPELLLSLRLIRLDGRLSQLVRREVDPAGLAEPRTLPGSAAALATRDARAGHRPRLIAGHLMAPWSSFVAGIAPVGR